MPTAPAVTDRRPSKRSTRLLVLDPIHPTAITMLQAHHHVEEVHDLSRGRLLEHLPHADVVVGRSGMRLDREALTAATRLRVVGRAGAGVDNVDLEAARERGIVVFNVPGASANAVAEHGLGLILALSRKIALADRKLRVGQWHKKTLIGSELAGQRVGIVGLGPIGLRLARLARALDMDVVATAHRAAPERAAALRAEGIAWVSLSELLRTSDVVCLALPLTDRTRGLVSRAELELMKPSALLINVARGGIVDEAALREALTSGRIAGAGLDVFAQEHGSTPFGDLDNVVMTPHIGGSTHQAQQEIGTTLVAYLHLALSGGDVPTRVC